jgi:DNA repair exonuclease SbcCD ATPase subunit
MVMDDAAAGVAKESLAVEQDSARIARLRERLERTLREAAKIEVELSRADGTIRGVPRYSVIEGRAHELGKQLSRTVQQQQMNELAAEQAATAKCPTCNARCPLETRRRPLQSVDGEAEVADSRGYCPGCRRAFFPAA